MSDPVALARAEGERILKFLSPDDREKMNAYIHVVREDAARDANQGEMVVGALWIGAVLLVAIPLGMFATSYFRSNVELKDKYITALEKRCIEQVVCACLEEDPR